MLIHDLSRRDLLKGGLAATTAGIVNPGLDTADADSVPMSAPTAGLRVLEARHSARLGVFAINHRTAQTIAYRADERFAFCSAYKGLLVARVLRDFDQRGQFLNRLVRYTKADLIDGDFITSLYVETGMTIRTLCAAAVGESDNTAANLLLHATGGPLKLTSFLRSIGDDVTRSDRTEPSVNTAIPGDARDTTTPKAIATSYTRLLLGRALSADDRMRLRIWMEGDAVNVKRFRAGLPENWLIADKTGTGDFGVANDVGVVWTSRGTPLTIAVLTTKLTNNAANDEALVAAAAHQVARHLAPGE